MITYVFPPAAWVGAHRTLKYCKYLGRLGWTPIVLTAKPKASTFQDARLLQQLPPEVKVHRTFDVDPTDWESRLASCRVRWGQRSTVFAAGQPSNPKDSMVSSGPLTRAKEFIKSLLKDSPDSHIFWVPFAFFRGLWILLTERIDVIYCSTPPHSSHLIAWLLAKCARKPYVLDFRDPWYVEGSARSPVDKIPSLLRLQTRTKRRIVRGAARIICVSQGEMNELQSEFPDLESDRFTFITNGYDTSDAPASMPSKSSSARLTLVHAGTVYKGVADEFFAALMRLSEDESGITCALQVHMLGEIAHEYAGIVLELENRGLVKVHGLQPHARTLEMIHACDVVVILMGGSRFLPSHLPSKAFEYLQAGQPILAVAGQGELAELVKRSGLGIVVPPYSVERAVEALRALLLEHASGELRRTPDLGYIRGFERSALAERLAKVLNEVVGARSVQR